MVEQAAEANQPVGEPRKGENRTAAIASIALWMASFGLAFIILPTSPLIWVPDALLLAGFVPLLYVWKPGWTWVVFGVLNVLIAVVLFVSRFLSDEELPAEMARVRLHLAEYHVPEVWFMFGVTAVLFGVYRMIKHLVVWMRARRRKSGV